MRRNRIVVKFVKEYNYPKAMLDPHDHLNDAVNHAHNDFQEDVKNGALKEVDFFQTVIEQPAYYTTTKKNQQIRREIDKVLVKQIVDYFVAVDLFTKYKVYSFDPETGPQFFNMEDEDNIFLHPKYQAELDRAINNAYDKIEAIRNTPIRE